MKQADILSFKIILYNYESHLKSFVLGTIKKQSKKSCHLFVITGTKYMHPIWDFFSKSCCLCGITLCHLFVITLCYLCVITLCNIVIWNEMYKFMKKSDLAIFAHIASNLLIEIPFSAVLNEIVIAGFFMRISYVLKDITIFHCPLPETFCCLQTLK